MFHIRFLFIGRVRRSICRSLMMRSIGALLSTISVCAIHLPPVLGFLGLCWIERGSIKVDKSYLFLGRYFQSWYCFPSLCVLSPGAPQWGSGTTKEQWVRAGLINTTEVLPGAWHNCSATIFLPRESQGIYSRLSADWALNDNLPHYQLCLLT